VVRSLSPAVQAVADYLIANEGYLWSTIRREGITCLVCTTPIDSGTTRCRPCTEHVESGIPIADQVGSLIYAPYGEQSYHLVKNYKADAPGPNLQDKMASLLAVGLRGHTPCAMALAGAAAAAWAVVPSLKQPDRPQPLRLLVERMAKNPGIRMRAGELVGDPRGLVPAHFIVEPDQDVPNFVILIEDSWVSGGHAQSAAAALKLWGVHHVAIFNVARVLDPNWGPTAQFMTQHRSEREFDPLRCPWTHGPCPQ
jgi:hypothetical protein